MHVSPWLCVQGKGWRGNVTVPRCANTKNNCSYLSGRRTVETWRETLRVEVGKRKPKESQRLQTVGCPDDYLSCLPTELSNQWCADKTLLKQFWLMIKP